MGGMTKFTEEAKGVRILFVSAVRLSYLEHGLNEHIEKKDR